MTIAETYEDERFIIDTDTKALWAIRKIREAEKEKAELVDFYRKQIEKAEKETGFRVDQLKALLEDYAETLPMKEAKTQRSYALPGAKLIFKKAHAVINHDDERIIKALKEKGRTEYIKTVEKLDWAGLKKVFTETGEAVDGITVELEPEAFEVKIGEEE